MDAFALLQSLVDVSTLPRLAAGVEGMPQYNRRVRVSCTHFTPLVLSRVTLHDDSKLLTSKVRLETSIKLKLRMRSNF